ncbi:MCE family protein, partial [Antrihabitans sp. NCIMB 15449]
VTRRTALALVSPSYFDGMMSNLPRRRVCIKPGAIQIANTLVKLNEIAQIVAANDQTVRDFSGRITELVALMAEQAPGLRDVLAQLNDFIENTSAVVGENREQLTGALTRLTGLTDQIRSNATNLTEIVDLTPLLFQNLDNAVSREHGALRLHALTDKSLLDGEALALFCERIQMRSDGCRTGKIADFGPDLGAPRVDSMTHRHTIGTTAVAVTTTLLLAVTGCGTTVADLPLPEPGIDGETYTVHAIFEDALNLPERAHVKIGGTDVGVVTAIDTVGFAADVEMQISADVELARDTTVELRQGTPLGDMFVAITTPPDRQGGDLLVDGDTITIDNTSAGASVEELLVSVSMLLNGGALNQVARISSELNSMFVGRAPQLSHLFVQLNGIMGSLNERTAQVDATLQGLDALMATMNQRKAELGQAAEEFPPVVGVIAEDNQSISRLIEKVSVTTAALGDFTDTTGPEFLSLFDNVQKLMDGFARMGDNLAGSLNGIHTLYEPVTESFQGNALAVAATVSFLSLGALTDPQGSRLPDGTDIGAFAGSLVDVIGRVIGRLQSPPR